MLRWKYFVQSEDDAFVKLIDAFTKATGVKVEHLARVVRRRAAESFGRRQYRHRPGPVLGSLFAAASVSAEVHRRLRRRRLPRQEIRRLGRQRGQIRQERQQVDRDPDLLLGRAHQLPPRSLEESRLLEIPGQDRRLPRIRQGDESAGHARRLRARSCFRRRQHLGALVLVVAWRPGRRQGRQGDHQLAGDGQGARIRQDALRLR